MTGITDRTDRIQAHYADDSGTKTESNVFTVICHENAQCCKESNT